MLKSGKVETKKVKIGKVVIGGGEPIAVQSMATTKTWDIKATVSQIKRLEEAGCEIIRVAVPDQRSVEALNDIKTQTNLPIVADCHFKPSLALAALDQNIDKIRINPGTMKDQGRVKEIVLKSKEKKIPIRIGVNAGSLHPKYFDPANGGVNLKEGMAQALVGSALDYVEFFEDLGFKEIVLSVKSSGVPETIEAYRLLSKKTSYPLHLGVTEAGTLLSGAIKSAVGLGILFSEGIGDTVRVSLAADPVKEVEVAYKILASLGLRKRGPELIACPSCGRAEINIISLAEEVEKKLTDFKNSFFKVAVMGCTVNGPGEAKEADIGIAGGKKQGLLFKKGKIAKKVLESQLVPTLMAEIKTLPR